MAISAATGSAHEHEDNPLRLTFTFSYTGFSTWLSTPVSTRSASTTTKDCVPSNKIGGGMTPGANRNVKDPSQLPDGSTNRSTAGSGERYPQPTSTVIQVATPQTTATILSSSTPSSKNSQKGGGPYQPGLPPPPEEEDPTTPAGAGSLGAVNATNSLTTTKTRSTTLTPSPDADTSAQTTNGTPAVSVETSLEEPSHVASLVTGSARPVGGAHPAVEGSNSESSMLASNAPAVFTEIVGSPSLLSSDSSTALATTLQTVTTEHQPISTAQATAALETPAPLRSGLSSRAKAGVAVGVIFVFVLAAVGAYLLRKKRRKSQNTYINPNDPHNVVERFKTARGRPVLPEDMRPTSWAQRAWAVLPGYRDAWDPSNYRRRAAS